jgi:hypothetical protein
MLLPFLLLHYTIDIYHITKHTTSHGLLLIHYVLSLLPFLSIKHNLRIFLISSLPTFSFEFALHHPHRNIKHGMCENLPFLILFHYAKTNANGVVQRKNVCGMSKYGLGNSRERQKVVRGIYPVMRFDIINFQQFRGFIHTEEEK